MKRILLVLAVGLLLVGLLPADDKPSATDATKEEMKKLEGTWKIDTFETTKGKAAGKDLPIDQIAFQADKMTVKKQGKALMTFGFCVDPSQKPKAMDWIHLKEKGNPHLPCIYAIEDGELRLCVPTLPKKGTKPEEADPIERPKSFAVEGTINFLVVAKREQP
jgi:uncharacterized protein (TIGR03067 family)